MRLSLVMATKGRDRVIGEFLRSLDTQGDHEVELIVVDQNLDDRVSRVLKDYRGRAQIVHMGSIPGLSRARNVGLRAVSGDIVAFPDDDCVYPPNLLNRVVSFFLQSAEYGGLLVRGASPAGSDMARMARDSGPVTPRNVWLRAVSYGLFFRRAVVEKVGGFDESLGVGSGTDWGAGEDLDYPLRALAVGCRLYFDPSLIVWHPDPLEQGFRPATERAFRYGAGFGRVWRKHRFPWWQVCYYLLRPIGGGLLGLTTGDVARLGYYWASFRGRLRGWLA